MNVLLSLSPFPFLAPLLQWPVAKIRCGPRLSDRFVILTITNKHNITIVEVIVSCAGEWLHDVDCSTVYCAGAKCILLSLTQCPHVLFFLIFF